VAGEGPREVGIDGKHESSPEADARSIRPCTEGSGEVSAVRSGPRINAFHPLYYHRDPTDSQVRALLEIAGISQ
jgi:hypothetical protein